MTIVRLLATSRKVSFVITSNGARHHARVAMIYAIETEMTKDGASPEEVNVALSTV